MLISSCEISITYMQNEKVRQLLSFQRCVCDLLLSCPRFMAFCLKFYFSPIDGNVALPHVPLCALVRLLHFFLYFLHKHFYSVIVRFNSHIMLFCGKEAGCESRKDVFLERATESRTPVYRQRRHVTQRMPKSAQTQTNSMRVLHANFIFCPIKRR